ncbi:MAG: biopolymer transporter ExbD [Campylobacter sp.]|nr:biopolymer transporter ExbD [Campylobacter sp.]
MENDFKLNVVPLIDVMLVLLTIVLCVASFIEYGKVDLNLPKSYSGSGEFPKDRVEINLDKNGEISFDNQKMSLSFLKENLQILPKDKFIIFKGDEKAYFGEFVEILQILKECELSNFVIMTQVQN